MTDLPLVEAEGPRLRPFRLAVLPALLAAVLGGAALAVQELDVRGHLGSIGVSRSDAASVRTDVLAGFGVLAVLLVLATAVVARRAGRRLARAEEDRREAARQALAEHDRAAREREQEADAYVRDWLAHLTETIESGRAGLEVMLHQVLRGERPDEAVALGLGEQPGDPDSAFAALHRDLRRLLFDAHTAVLHASAHQQVEVFVTIARRLQSLVTRSLQELDALEGEVEDPELLGGLLRVDHLGTRLRRHVESLAVLGGATPRRVGRPVAVYTVLRQALSEIEQYARVKIVRPVEGTLRGHAVTDVIHLVAELIENATNFSRPETQVFVRAQLVSSGLAIEIDDRGLGIPDEDRERLERLLARPDLVDLGEQLKDGRIGLFVVARLAMRHGIMVRPQTNIYGGTQAVVVIPHALLEDEAALSAAAQQAAMQQAAAQQAAAQQALAAVSAAGSAGTAGATADAERRADPRRAPAQAAREQGYGHPAEAAAPGASSAAAQGFGSAAYGQQQPQPQPGSDTGSGGDDAAGAGGRPPLPRRSGSYLVPQLRDRVATEDSERPSATPDLMARFARGLRRADQDPDRHPDRDGFADRRVGPPADGYAQRGHQDNGFATDASAGREAEPQPYGSADGFAPREARAGGFGADASAGRGAEAQAYGSADGFVQHEPREGGFGAAAASAGHGTAAQQPYGAPDAVRADDGFAQRGDRDAGFGADAQSYGASDAVRADDGFAQRSYRDDADVAGGRGPEAQAYGADDGFAQRGHRDGGFGADVPGARGPEAQPYGAADATRADDGFAQRGYRDGADLPGGRGAEAQSYGAADAAREDDGFAQRGYREGGFGAGAYREGAADYGGGYDAAADRAGGYDSTQRFPRVDPERSGPEGGTDAGPYAEGDLFAARQRLRQRPHGSGGGAPADRADGGPDPARPDSTPDR